MSKLEEVRAKRVTINLAGEERLIKYDMNAFAEMEEIYGSIDAALSCLERNRMSDVRTILWLGLIHDQAIIDEETGDPVGYKLSKYQVGSWIEDITMLKDVAVKLGEALSGDLPTPTEEEQAKLLAERELKN